MAGVRGGNAMSFELSVLAAAAFLGLVHIAAASFAFKAQVGNRYTVGPRDDDLRPSGMAGRLARAQSNFLETYAFFATFILIVEFTESAGAFSWWGALIYLGGRVLFLPLYAWGVPWLRTIIWKIATLGLVLVGVQLIV
jgi:uncharacterized MAPEG superfamily protein